MDFTILPPGTMIYAPDDIHRVTFQFPDEASAIVFHEFIRDFVEGRIVLEVEEKR